MKFILNMLKKSVDEKTISELVGCPVNHIFDIKNKGFASK